LEPERDIADQIMEQAYSMPSGYGDSYLSLDGTQDDNMDIDTTIVKAEKADNSDGKSVDSQSIT